MKRRTLVSILRGVAIAAIVVVFLGPIVWMLLASFKLNVDIYDAAKTFFFHPTMINYINVFGKANYLLFIKNSFIIAAVSTGLSLVLGVPAAYAMARFAMRKSANLVLLARVVPGISLLVPWYYVFASLKLTGGFTVLILAHMFVGLPLIVFIMMSFFEQLPEDLEEAGQVDGLTPIGAFWHITLPLSAPGVATSTILSFIFSWNNFMFALALSQARTQTLPVAIFGFISYSSIDWGGLMAASAIVTTPIMLIALFTQKYIVTGFTAGATKG